MAGRARTLMILLALAGTSGCRDVAAPPAAAERKKEGTKPSGTSLGQGTPVPDP